MNNLKKYMGLLLALVMCLSLVACGGNAPEKLQTIVIDDSVEYDYSAFSGTWSGKNDNKLVVEEFDDGRNHFQLSDANDEWTATGILQYSEEYGCVYAHNDNDGHAYKCWFDDDNALHISSLGAFSKASGDVSEKTTGNDSKLPHRDVSEYRGTWYPDEDISAETYIVIDVDGTWSYCQRSSDNTEITMIDCGIFAYSTEEAYVYYANSTVQDDVRYRVHEFDEDVLVWGDIGTFYRMEE